MREKYIEQKLVREVKKRGGLCEKWNSGRIQFFHNQTDKG